jgi:hypothetical protein
MALTHNRDAERIFIRMFPGEGRTKENADGATGSQILLRCIRLHLIERTRGAWLERSGIQENATRQDKG